ncbi:MAG: sulfite exporter TauE/SafE family protein [Mesorhizobium sp.]|uniref:sulfite exporter TauE/SafE family protein n=1 Tax=Mesorhizobium sp. TaxID=1871066 RepID=UPI000FE8B1B9|nr:sulfite exporter TauE/SafE family protein [Mesorhizobium sp.]RWM19367.1 MAG: sulfite exporter TauE/SafE family protein [Mesorhizobium sp.]TIP73164.1 MAG: sulfite exporter TauE/SafE family protein [Mesorhizobium sp.]TIQ13887.1 MAG: sulfite exporter TauE/SafE family protein [Mesorhizobium sp.]TIR49625.1 MAG: sulfite exporter TauE/SafE family protein [Mesorhizobium sp.]TJV98190.1 MAG: sulfite exporter TauE/SafE family protein [Mesorhizobium sp.]
MDSLVFIVAIGAVVAGFVQGLSGFAFSLVAMSFWVWTVEPQLAAAMAVFGALTGQIIAAITVRRGFDLKLLLPFLVGGIVGIPVGVAILPLLDMQLFKLVFGALLVTWCPLMLFARHIPRITVGGHVADGAIGLIGGVMGGLGGFTGPVPTLWCVLRQWEKDRQRIVIQNFNLATLSLTMVAYIAAGKIKVEMLPMFAIVAPAMLIPTLLGARLYIGMSEATFRKIVLTLLAASGAAMLASALPHLTDLNGYDAAEIPQIDPAKR